jgi:HD-like signal output (HDOD) protein
MSVVAAPFSREKLLTVARSLPADLNVLSKLGEMLQDVNSELDEIAGLLRRDVALAARIVRISNSPMFGCGGVASVEEAVNRVGFGEILKLVGTATAASLGERGLDHYDISAVQLRDNMLYGAFACEALARAAGTDVRAAYTAGLLRPLGMMVLDRVGRNALNRAQWFRSSQALSYSAWEGSVFGLDSSEVTGLILDEWKFPRELGGAIRGHYLKRASDYDGQLACILNVAHGLAQVINRAFPGESTCWELTPEKLQGAGVTAAERATAAIEAKSSFDAALAALGVT